MSATGQQPLSSSLRSSRKLIRHFRSREDKTMGGHIAEIALTQYSRDVYAPSDVSAGTSSGGQAATATISAHTTVLSHSFDL